MAIISKLPGAISDNRQRIKAVNHWENHTVQSARSCERYLNSQNVLIPCRKVLQVFCVMFASRFRGTREFSHNQSCELPIFSRNVRYFYRANSQVRSRKIEQLFHARCAMQLATVGLQYLWTLQNDWSAPLNEWKN